MIGAALVYALLGYAIFHVPTDKSAASRRAGAARHAHATTDTQREHDNSRCEAVQDSKGNRSPNLGGSGITNVDLVLGQGRVTGQAILKDVGKAQLERTYATAPPAAAPTAQPPSMSPALAGALGVAGLGLFAVAFELGHRRPKAA